MAFEINSSEHTQLHLIGLTGFSSFAFIAIATAILSIRNHEGGLAGAELVTTVFIVLTIAVVLMRYITNPLRSRTVRIILQILATLFLGVALIIICFFAQDAWLHLAALVLLAAAVALYALTWFTYLATLGHIWLAFVFSAGIIFSGVVLCVIANQGVFGIAIAMAILAILEFGSFIMLDDSCPPEISELIETNAADYDNNAARKNVPALFLTGGTWGVVAGIVSWINDDAIVLLIIGISTTVAALFVLVLKRSFQYTFEAISLRFGVLSVSIGLACIPFALENFSLLIACCAYLTAIATSHCITSFSAIAESARFDQLPPVWLFSKQGIWYCLGALIFLVMFSAVITFSSPSLVAAACFATILVFQFLSCLSADAIYPQDDITDNMSENSVLAFDNDAPASALTANKAGWKSILDTVAQDNGLTPRQREVMELLVKGRDSRYIEETFVVSHATAKTHIANLYRKMGIHSKRELIDYLESLRNSM